MVAVAAGVPLGIVSALRRGSWTDYAVRLVALGGLSVPNFWLATLFLLAGVSLFGWIPSVVHVRFLEDPLGNLAQGYLACHGAGVLGGSHHQPHDPVCAA